MTKHLDRRAFLKLSAIATAGAATGLAGGSVALGAPFDPNRNHVEPDEWVYSTCGFCGTGCGIEIGVKGGEAVAIRGTKDYPVNTGFLCAKGILQWQAIMAPDRGTTPLLRKNGQLVKASWDEALDAMTGKLKEIITKHGPNAVATYNTGQLLLEEFYTLGKIQRAGIGTDHCDSNTRLCMASAVYGHNRTFGADVPTGAYADVEETDVILLVGSNMAECHPILMGRLTRAREQKGTKLIVVDPRITQPARMADIHLAIKPGTDVTLLNAMAQVLIQDGLIDQAYIDASCSNWPELKAKLTRYTPEFAAQVCGVPAEEIVAAARLYGKAPRSLSMWVMGINQSVNGVTANHALHNLNLIQGKLGKPGSASFSVTGQPNAMGNRSAGGSSNYPGMRPIDNEQGRREIAALWGVPYEKLPAKSTPIEKIIDKIIAGDIKALWVLCTNPLLSLPDQNRVKQALAKLELLVVQDAYYTVDTNEYAHVYLPAAMWAEKQGVMINSERRVNLVQPSIKPPGEAKSDFEILRLVAQKMGYGHLVAFQTPAACFEEFKQTTKGRPNEMTGITYERLVEHRGLQWPVSEAQPNGTQRAFTDGTFFTKDKKAKLWAVEQLDLPELPDAAYPFMLNTGRVQEHYHTGTKTRKIKEMNLLVPTVYVEINPKDAAELGIAYGDMVVIESKRGAMKAKAVITQIGAPKSVFVPMHFHEGPVNALTVWAFDPISGEPNYKQQAVRIRKA
ncbi:MAG TPA: nitrate reductase [Symbiobacteriaceae bacterium]|nr:nitrate reductase [Symbiobacteriaceae bacterium]